MTSKIEGLSAETVEFDEWYSENGYYHDTVSSRKDLMKIAWEAAITALLASGEVAIVSKSEDATAALIALSEIEYHPYSPDDGHYDYGFDFEQSGQFFDKHIETVRNALKLLSGEVVLRKDVEELAKYARHRSNCKAKGDGNRASFDGKFGCDCGLEKSLAKFTTKTTSGE